MGIILWLVFGALVGWLASKVMNASFGLVVSIVLGIVGSVVGGWVASLIGIGKPDGFNIGNILISVGGACLVVFAARKLIK